MDMFTIDEAQYTTILPVAVCPLFIFLYRIIVNSEVLKEFLYGERPTEREEFNYSLLTKFTGALILAVIPGFLFYKLLPSYTYIDYGLSFTSGFDKIYFYWLMVLGPIIIIINAFVTKRNSDSSCCQQIQLKKWEVKRIGIYSIAGILYLFAFELLYRGFLFFPLVNTIDVVSVITINVLIFAISLSGKRVNDTIGKLLFHIVLCMATYQTGTIWVAFTAQVVNSLSSNLFVLRFQSEMRVIKAKGRW